MVNKKVDPRVQRTQNLLSDALIELIVQLFTVIT